MYALKTQPNDASVEAYLAGIEDPLRRKDCAALAQTMSRITACPPLMWGSSIVGFDRYHYRYRSGHEGSMCQAGFSCGKAHISIYLFGGFASATAQALLARLGKHKTGKACLYIKRLSDVRPPVFEELLALSVAEIRAQYPRSGA